MYISELFGLATLVATSKAWYPCIPASLTLAQLVGEPQCLANQTAFHAFNQISIPDHAPSDVWKLIGNYNNLSWEGNDTITHTGTPNAPNDTRIDHEKGITESEVLNVYVGPSSDPPNPTQSLYFQQSTILPLGQSFDGVSIGAVQRLTLVTSNGTGTSLSFEASGCVSNAANATLGTKLFTETGTYNAERVLAILTGAKLPTEEEA